MLGYFETGNIAGRYLVVPESSDYISISRSTWDDIPQAVVQPWVLAILRRAIGRLRNAKSGESLRTIITNEGPEAIC